jgi:hypothetical protein
VQQGPAEFFTAADQACRMFEAASPAEALQLACQFYDDNLVQLDFRSTDGIEPLDQIQICNPNGHTVAIWESVEFRLRRAAPKLLDALHSIYQHDREFADIEDPETMLCRIKDKARAAIAMAGPPPD